MYLHKCVYNINIKYLTTAVLLFFSLHNIMRVNQIY